MTKEDRFLWTVQTALLQNSIRLSFMETYKKGEAINADQDEQFSRIFMREAVRAATLIPADMDAADAADEFCIHLLRGGKLPYWYARA
ncbi:hypothetical protein PY365_28685 [Roseiarcaceae bacterium H3SJ34-1]|uniref:hypothetical protein n=1 Tax=Terripilifer ovatus TaxID=3032367 RepID=UPI003AB975D7|nr:hypothetical protein [Roseiarcaceae bacterium H3SJ34-1]